MPTQPKPAAVLEKEGKSHRTKAELIKRKQEEKALLTGKRIQESSAVKQDEVAHKTYLRVIKLLDSIQKNDALYEAIINRYCRITAECLQFEEKRENFYQRLQSFEEKMDDLMREKELSVKEAYRMMNDFEKSVIDADKELQAKRKMLLDIEKECCMTVAAALRSIPKKPEVGKNPLLEALRDD